MGRKFVLILMLLFVLALSCKSTSALRLHEVAQPQPRLKQKLIVGVMSAPPYSMEAENGTWSGITVDLWKEIARIIDVDYEFKKVDLPGLITGLESGTLDLAATGVSITAAREKKVDFSDPYLAASEAIAINADQQPNLLEVLRSTLLDWALLAPILGILALAAAGAAVLWLLEHKGDSEHYSGRTTKAFGKSLFWSTMVLTGRELPKTIGWSILSPATVVGKLFGVVWMMVGIMLISIFTASVASVLTSKQLQGVIHDPDDLRHVTVGTVASSVGYEYLQHHSIKCNHVYESPEEMLQALSEHKFDAAVYNRHVMVYYARSMYLHKIVVLRFPLRQDFLAIPMRTGNPLSESINEALLEVIESKKWQEIVSKYLGDDWVNAGST